MKNLKKKIFGGLAALVAVLGISTGASAASMNGVSVNSYYTNSASKVALQNSNAYPVTLFVCPITGNKYYETGLQKIELKPGEKKYVAFELPAGYYGPFKLQVETQAHTYSGTKDGGTFYEYSNIQE
jgi:hypothetical protein